MGTVFGILIGFIFFSMLKGKPLNIHIKHEYDNKYVQMPSIEEALDPKHDTKDKTLDSVYAGMGNVLNSITDLMNGVEPDDQERK